MRGVSVPTPVPRRHAGLRPNLSIGLQRDPHREQPGGYRPPLGRHPQVLAARQHQPRAFLSSELEFGLAQAVETKALADINGTSGIQTQAYATWC